MAPRRKKRPPLHMWFHCYADGAWQTPTYEFLDALCRFGLGDKLAQLHVGFVGSPENIDAATDAIFVACGDIDIVATAPSGWEQETLEPLWNWTQDHDGLVGYAHTKGASRNDPIDPMWRRAMLYYNVVEWRRPVDALVGGKSIAGCHWHPGGPSSVEGFGTGGMFGGNFWWTRAELLRRNVAPGKANRFEAEHWLGQLSEVTPLTPETIEDLHPNMIPQLATVPAW